jgi:hypothetical protein
MQCQAHGNAMDGIAATKPTMVHGVLGHHINIQGISTDHWQEPGTLGSVVMVTYVCILVSVDRKVLPQLVVVRVGLLDLIAVLVVIEDHFHGQVP